MGTFSCPCCVCPACVCAGSRGLLKLSQAGRCWLAGRNWEAVSEAERCWGMFSQKNIGRIVMATFDNSYRICYNKCNDNNKNVISHQTGKNAPTRRFAPAPL